MNVALSIKILLVVSIVLQSLTAAVSARAQSHQIDIAHLQTQHDHNSDSHGVDDNSGDENHDIKDCHHCGHCSGSHLSWISINAINGCAKLFNINRIPYQFDQSKEFLDAILRPPIA